MAKKLYCNTKDVKYPEQLSSKESMRFQPAKVTLMVVWDEEDDEPRPYVIYLRAKSPTEAQTLAYAFFKDQVGVGPLIAMGVPETSVFPQLDFEGEHECEKIDEDEYMSAWVEAKCARVCRFIGDERNPRAFHFSHTLPGEKKNGGIILPSTKKIITPSAEAVEFFQGGN